MATDDGLGCFASDADPLISDRASVWDRLVEAVDPGSLLVVIDRRLGDKLGRVQTAEDILQETLLHAWRDRKGIEWRGIKAFRSWLLTIIDHRIRDAADRQSAAKRGGGRPTIPFSVLQGSGSHDGDGSRFPGPHRSTTPSRIASYKERAEAIKSALASLPPELRYVVHLRIHEQVPIAEVARRLDISESTAARRFRDGSEMYARRLISELATRSRATVRETTADPPRNPAP